MEKDNEKICEGPFKEVDTNWVCLVCDLWLTDYYPDIMACHIASEE